MRRDIQLNTRVTSAHYDELKNIWNVKTTDGQSLTCHFFIPATGALSASLDPPFPGLDTFKGDWYKSSNWGNRKLNFEGKRVAVVGTGATGVQIVPIVAHNAASVTVFQRTPNYVLPGRNYQVTEALNQEVKRNYDDVWNLAQNQVFGFAMPTSGRTIADVDDAGHQQVLEAGWEAGGFRFIFETFDDMLLDPKSNEVAAEFVRRKIRAVVKDPKKADLLCPKYPLMAKRPPLGHFYYEAYNRPNVQLVDVSKNPIVEATTKGLRTATDEYEFDIIIFAIGFDVATGGLDNIDIRGPTQSLKEDWSKRLETYLGIGVEGFPNLLLIAGPQVPSANVPVVIDHTAEWIGNLISHMRKNGYRRLEPKSEAVDRWCDQCQLVFDSTLLAKASEQVSSWYIGANVPGKRHTVLLYFGGLVEYMKHSRKEAGDGYQGFKFS
jgi:cation diffusion facilitator CzcD-associated flavoprotein CzcO